MKNLLVYINPRKNFDEESRILAKIQIDNSLDLGWKIEDILFAANFPYEYKGIKSLIIPSESYCDYCPTATKMTAIVKLFENNLIEKGQLYWSHDLDVYQNEVITESELELEAADIGLTDKGRMPRWNGGSIFFKESSKDIFGWANEITYKYKKDEERALMALAMNNILWVTETEPESTIGNRIVPTDIPGAENINERIKKINISYNFRGWNIRPCYEMAVKPIRVVHFHPFDPAPYPGANNALEFFMYGKNKINTVLMPERLIKIFNEHGIK